MYKVVRSHIRIIPSWCSGSPYDRYPRTSLQWMSHLSSCWDVEIQLRLADLRIHGEGGNMHTHAGTVFVDLYERLGLEITQDETLILHRHFVLFVHKALLLQPGLHQQVSSIYPTPHHPLHL